MTESLGPDIDPPDGPAVDHSRLLRGRIRDEAAARGGLLPFDRFMELALYAPGLGYYVAGAQKFGRSGDFVTAPELTPLYGRCVAAQCREVLAALSPAYTAGGAVWGGDILELGAGSGALAVQVLLALEEASALPRRYLILEPSPELRTRQRRSLALQAPHLAPLVHWCDRLPAGLRGCVLANEVVDAMPVHRFCIGACGEPQELFVRWAGEGFEEVAADPVSPGLAAAVRALQGLGLACEPGYVSEINLRLGPWMGALAAALARGMLLIVDYGYAQDQYYRAERRTGTLLCHYRHRAGNDPYGLVGLADITAHVDFTALAHAGTSAGMRLAGYTTQAHFLIGCGIEAILSQLADGPDAMDALLAAKQLLLPGAMGERFQVIALDKGMDQGPAPAWTGFSFRDLRDRLGQRLGQG